MKFNHGVARMVEMIARRQIMKALEQSLEMDLTKCPHSAMAHHAKHAEAAMRAGKGEVARKHMHMFMRHAIDNVKDRDMWAMKDGLKNNLDFYSQEGMHLTNGRADDEGKFKDNPLVEEMKKKGKYTPHSDDKGIGKGKIKKADIACANDRRMDLIKSMSDWSSLINGHDNGKKKPKN